MKYGRVIDVGYVVDIHERESFYQSNVGIFRTKRRAEEQCERLKAMKGFNCEVRKVSIVIMEDEE